MSLDFLSQKKIENKLVIQGTCTVVHAQKRESESHFCDIISCEFQIITNLLAGRLVRD